MPASRLWLTLALLRLAAPAEFAAADGSLWLPAIFADRMVLQREMPVPVWGRYEPGEGVTAELVGRDGQPVARGTAVADGTGRWRVDLPALAAGGPYSLVVTGQGAGAAEPREKTFADVLVREVWIACGQSNMGFQVATSAERDDAEAGRLGEARTAVSTRAAAGFLVHQKGKTDLDMNPQAVAEAAGKNAFHPLIGLREAGARVADEDPHVGLAVTIDVGDKFDIHPPRKRPVGERLTLQARKLVYGDQAVVADGPVAREFRREGPGFVVAFESAGGGLVARGDLAGFELSDAAGVWHAAEATIRGNTIEVRAASVPEPAGVRYAWAGYPEATLANQAGLPARPFRHPALDLEALQKESEEAK